MLLAAVSMCRSVTLLAGAAATVTSRLHYITIYARLYWNYYMLYQLLPRAESVQRLTTIQLTRSAAPLNTAVNYYEITVPCTAEELTPLLKMGICELI
jgi:hypothetical protein